MTPVTSTESIEQASLPTTATAVVGMIGGGQLARMTHQAAIALGVELRVLDHDANAPAVMAGALHHAGHHTRTADLHAFAQTCDVITLDHEHTAVADLAALVDAGHTVRPNPFAASLASDKGLARRALKEAGFPVPAFNEVTAGDMAAVEHFATRHGWPIVLKAPVGGYDGRGVEVVRTMAALEGSALAARSPRWLLEEAVPIVTELAVIVARRPSGHSVVYPVVETVQRDGICHELVAPARVDETVAVRATALAASLADGLDTTGILAVEMFLTESGSLLVNEIATRPHNSGHATLDANVTSQFENHLRGVLDWPLGSPQMHAAAAVMVNVLGGERAVDLARAVPEALADPAVRVHLYRKAWAPGRKLGHVTAVADDIETARRSARAAADLLTRG